MPFASFPRPAAEGMRLCRSVRFRTAAMLLAAAAVTGFSAYNKTNVPDLLSANVEALAQNEGTNVSTCYFKSFYGDVGGYAECDDRTSTSTIYPCPDRTSYFSASSSSMCTN